ncbi:MAG: hypothetical protein GTO40_14420 [Deltaproteobacteria bacterium]|nr:hypothetical protein [Deltaproteobacteria bacterium]
MNRIDFLQTICEARAGAAMIISPGLANYPIAAGADHPMTLYNMDMPYATPMALGVALGWPERQVVSIEGDGSLLAGTGVLTTIARYQPSNLVIFVMDNESYLTTGSGLSSSATATGADIEKLARAAGMVHTATVRELESGRVIVQRVMKEPGPWLVVAKVDKNDQHEVDRSGLPVDVFESAMRFRRAALLEKS